MTGRPRRPLFLAPAGYRRRRLRDAARVLPVFAAGLLLLPVLWAPGNSGHRETAGDGIYLFLVWLAVIAAAGVLARPLRAETDDPAPVAEDED
jgi:hypothetical protein